ncbi:MAG: hypothetical protein ACRDEA_11725 [Microcystaceae cyanobacterium]
MPNSSKPVEVLDNSSDFHSVKEDEEIGQHKPEKVVNHLCSPDSSHPSFPSRQSLDQNSVPTDSSGMAENSSAYREWKPKPIEGEPVTPEQFRAKLSQLSQRLSMPIQQEKTRAFETSKLEELNLWLADPLLRKEVMPRVMKRDRYTFEFDEYGEPLRVVEVKS